MGYPVWDVVFSYHAPTELFAGTYANSLSKETGLDFEHRGKKIYLVVRMVPTEKNYRCQSFEDIQKGINKIDREEFRNLIMKNMDAIANEQKPEIA